jgi:hypothetical protein
MTDLTGADFATSDGTFKATQRDGEVHFDLGSQKRKKKSAIYKNGTVTVDFAPASHTSQSGLAAYFADIRMFRLTFDLRQNVRMIHKEIRSEVKLSFNSKR